MRAFLLGFVMCVAASARAEDGPGKTRGQESLPVPLVAGRAQVPGVGQVAWELHYNRNSLRDSRRVPGGWISLTDAGSLILFDDGLQRVRKEYFGPAAATCLGGDDQGAVFAGFTDGRIVAVASDSLALTKVAAVSGAIAWIGYRKEGWVVVHEPASSAGHSRRWRSSLVVTDLGTGKKHPLDKIHPSSFLLDRRSRLWLGEDHGEWGGGVAVLDLGTGAVGRKDSPQWKLTNVYGFVELSDGQIWSFGGMMHMGLLDWHITRVDGTKPEALFRGDNLGRRGKQEPKGPPASPRLPITHVIENGHSELLVFSYGDIFRVDRSLRKWRYVATVDLRYFPGRPDAVGSYPAIQRVVPLDRGRLLLVTGGDGHVILEGKQVTPRALPGQFGMRSQDEILNSPVGPLFLSHDDRESPWRLAAGSWEITQAEPPFRLALKDILFGEKDERFQRWFRVRVLKSPSDTVYTIANTAVSPGTLAVDRWEKSGFVPLSTSVQTYDGDYCFFSPDGELWLRDWDGQFLRLADGRWQPAGAKEPGGDAFYLGLRFLTTSAPPWLAYVPSTKALLRFDPGKDNSAPRTEGVRMKWSEKPLDILDALAQPDGTVLLGTEQGLFRFDTQKGTLSASPLVPKGEAVRSLLRDGRGRLWLSGKSIKVVVPEKPSAISISGVPAGDDSWIRLLGSYPGRPDGMVVGLQSRGVLLIEVTK